MINHRSKSTGFTLVETLIAVAILMVAIAGPLTVANQALTSALGSRNAMIATYLAQEGMESIKNIKDNNLTANNTTLTNYLGNPNASCQSGSNFSNCYQTPTAWNGSGFIGSASPTVCSTGNCQLSLDSNGVYVYSGGVTSTPFTRYYYVSQQSTNINEVTVIVVVDWTDNSVPNEIKLQELMTNIKR